MPLSGPCSSPTTSPPEGNGTASVNCGCPQKFVSVQREEEAAPGADDPIICGGVAKGRRWRPHDRLLMDMRGGAREGVETGIWGKGAGRAAQGW